MRFAPLTHLPASVIALGREALRIILKRPVVGVSAAALVPDGRVVLIRRGDTGGWAMPGGTLEWGELLSDALPRELLEEAGVVLRRVKRVTGVYSRPDRDPRFHAVTIVVACEVELPSRPPMNPLEILEVGLFEPARLPSDFSMGCADMLETALRDGASPAFE